MPQPAPRIMLSAAGSGAGKTTMTAALLSALCSRGLQVQGWKCGPDYIDPMFHSHITGQTGVSRRSFFSVRTADGGAGLPGECRCGLCRL